MMLLESRRLTRFRKLVAEAMTLLIFATVAGFASVPSDMKDPFSDLIGVWSCHGHFVANGRELDAVLTFTADPATGTLRVSHDDAPPGAYHANELWSVVKPSARAASASIYRAAVADLYSGMRWFGSSGWQGQTLTWVRPEQGPADETFAYTLLGSHRLRVDWSVRRDSGELVLGDTLLCTPHRAQR